MYLLIYFHCKLFSSVFEFSWKKALKICIIIIIIITQSSDKLQFRFYCFTLKLLFDDLVDTDNATCKSFHAIVVAKKAVV